MSTAEQNETEVGPPRGRFTIVYMIHEAFRRDLGRLRAAVGAERVEAPRASQLKEHWAFVYDQLHHHHRVEDDSLWPLVRPKVAGRTDELAVLDEMETEHHALEPKCLDIDQGFDTFAREPGEQAGSELAARIEALEGPLFEHLDNEETRCFPVIDEALSAEEFESFGKATAKAVGMRGSARFFPWIFDGADRVECDAVLQMPPPPVRILCRRVWEPRYTRKVATLWVDAPTGGAAA